MNATAHASDRPPLTPRLPRGFTPRPDPAQAERLRAKFALPGLFWLYAGGYRRNKNIPLLLRA